MGGVHGVAVIVAPGFADELERIADVRHVWALRLPEYERVAQKRWSTEREHDLDGGITVFNGGGPSPEAKFIAIFATIEDHHGADSRAPALSEIEVLGAQPTAEVRAELSEYGFEEVSPSQRGFAARRDV
jgi:hypothetical protein